MRHGLIAGVGAQDSEQRPGVGSTRVDFDVGPPPPPCCGRPLLGVAPISTHALAKGVRALVSSKDAFPRLH